MIYAISNHKGGVGKTTSTIKTPLFFEESPISRPLTS